jgi:hypothetical protein
MTNQGVSQVMAPEAWTNDGTGVIAEATTASGEAVVAAMLSMSRISK